MVFNKITELFTKLKDGSGNNITSTVLEGSKRGIDVTISGKEVAVDASKRLQVSLPTASAPPETTPVDEGGRVIVAGPGGTDVLNWVIPNGETLVLQGFDFSGYVTKKDIMLQAKCELWYQPNGSVVGQVLIKAIYLQGQSSDYKPLHEEYMGDGTARIQMLTTNISGEDGEFVRYFEGYY